MTENNPGLITLFTEALERTDPTERAAYLDRICGDNADLRRRVEELLAAHQRTGRFHQPEPQQTVDRTGTFQTENQTGEYAGGDSTHTYGSRSPRAERSRTTDLGTVIAGRYTLVEVIGEGGMGSVYRAEQSEPVKRPVALKLIKTGMDSRGVLARFDAERQALALMDHPNIARIYDGGVTDRGQPFFVMELVQGVPLTDYCDSKRLSVEARLQLFVAVCNAVQHAHQKGIIHRDLKPGNVLVTEVDGRPTPKVIDFGVAKATEQRLTDMSLNDDNAIVGTPAYMSPEQADPTSNDIDTRSDVYALGVILYELLTGTQPIEAKQFKRGAILEMLRMVREVEPPRPSTKLSTAEDRPNIAANRNIEPKQLASLLQGELDWLVMKALEKDRSRRYETANGFAADVMRYLSGEAVLAHPPSRAYRLKKFVRRNRLQVIAGSVIAVTLVAGIIGTTFGLIEAKKQEAEAFTQAGLAREETKEKEKARLEEAKQRNLAVTEKQIAEAVKKFLQSKLLAQADARTQANALLEAGEVAARAKPNPTIRELLDRASKELAPDKIEANFPNQPLVQAEILLTVGNAYVGLREVATGISLLARSVELRKAHLGPNHPDTLKSTVSLAMGYLEADQPEKALPLVEETLKLRKGKLGPDHPDTLQSMHQLAVVFFIANQSDKALPLLEETFKLTRAKLGPDHADTLVSMSDMAMGYARARKFNKAVEMFEETLKLSTAKLGPEHPDTLASMTNLAAGYQAVGRLDKAVPLLEDTVKLQKVTLGPDHPDTLQSISNLGTFYQATGKADKVLPLFEEVLPVLKAKLGPDHSTTLKVMNNLAVSYEIAGQRQKAMTLFEELLKHYRTKFGPDDPTTLFLTNNMTVDYLQAGQLDKAQPLLEEAFKHFKVKLGPDHAQTLRTMNNLNYVYENTGQFEKAEPILRERLSAVKMKSGVTSTAYAGVSAQLGVNLLGQKKWVEAEQLLRECLAVREKKEPDAWNTFNTQSVLGAALVGQKKYAEAEPLLVKGYEGLKAREKTLPATAKARISLALDRLIELYTATNKPDDLKKYQELRVKHQPAKEVAPMPREKK